MSPNLKKFGLADFGNRQRKRCRLKNHVGYLNPQENTANEISLMRYEIILTDYELFCLAAKYEIKTTGKAGGLLCGYKPLLLAGLKAHRTICQPQADS